MLERNSLIAVIAITAAICLAPWSIGQAVSAPGAMRGKSVIMTFTETFQARRLGSQWRNRRLRWTLMLYIGTKGEIFTRVVSRDTTEGVGKNTKAHAGGRRSWKWSGRKLIGTASTTFGGVRRGTVTFNGAFTSCNVRMIVAKRPGTRIVRSRRGVEIVASSWRVAGGSTCRVAKGNVFR